MPDNFSSGAPAMAYSIHTLRKGRQLGRRVKAQHRLTQQMQRTLELSSAIEACRWSWLRATAGAFDGRR